MQYSPKLKKAMEEIKQILEKNDIAGFVVLHTPGFSEYLNHIGPSYSCAKLEQHGLTFKLKTSEVGREKAKEIAEGTYNMMSHFADIVGMNAMLFIQGCKFLEEKFDTEKGPGDHTSHNQQNN